jgi:hypothetical protein
MLPVSFRKDDLDVNKVVFTISMLISLSLGYFAGKNDSFLAIKEDLGEVSEPISPRLPQLALPSPANLSENNFHSDSDSSRTQQSSSSLAVTQQVTQQQLDAVKTEYEFKQRSEAFTQWLTKNQESKPWFDLGIEMGGRFEAEEADYSWSLAEEAHLQSLFSQAPALAGVALKSTRCKSTQCQITISVMDQEHANETAMTISQVLGSEGATQIIIDNQVQKGEAIFYVARNEKGFEFN